MASGTKSMRLFLLIACLCEFVFAVAAQTGTVPQASSAGGYRIAGTVVSKTDGHALIHARVSLRDVSDVQKIQSLLTAEDGKFEFTGLPAGKYALGGAKKGFVSAAYDQHEEFSTAIVTGAGLETETLLLRLAPDAVITGKVLDEFGEPVRHAMVTLYRDDHSSGVDQIRQSRSSQTDDLGTFELTPLNPGTYFLSASAKPWYAVHPNTEARRGDSTAMDRSLDVAYPVTYYADVADSDSATPILVQGGERVEADIHLNPVPALHLFFNLSADERRGVQLPQLQQNVFDGTASVQGTGGNPVRPGLIELTGIPAGRYNVRMGGPGAGIQMNGVDLSKDGEHVDTSHAEPLSSVKVSVRVAGESTLPTGLRIGLRSAHREPVVAQEINARGEAELQDVPVGKYEVATWGAAKPYSISRIVASGGEISGHTLTLAGGASPSISLTLAGGSVEVQGVVKMAGKPFAGAMVVLVPKNAEVDRDLFRRDQSDLDGSFRMRGVVPGSYTVLAIQNGWDLDWSQPGALALYLKRGQAIEISDKAGRSMNLAEAVEVQSK
jgi:hypothetical protein